MKCPFKNCVKGEMTAYGLVIHLRQRHKADVVFPIYLKFWLNGTIELLDATMTKIADNQS